MHDIVYMYICLCVHLKVCCWQASMARRRSAVQLTVNWVTRWNSLPSSSLASSAVEEEKVGSKVTNCTVLAVACGELQ